MRMSLLDKKDTHIKVSIESESGTGSSLGRYIITGASDSYLSRLLELRDHVREEVYLRRFFFCFFILLVHFYTRHWLPIVPLILVL